MINKKINKNKILVILIAIIFCLFFFSKIKSTNEIASINIPKEVSSNQVLIINNETKDNFVDNIYSTSKDNKIKESNENNQLAYLNVLDKSYMTSFNEGETVYDIMVRLKDKGLYFDYKKYPSLGVFVTEINGIQDGSGKYWIYYINNKEAQVGVSRYVVKPGDIIDWELE